MKTIPLIINSKFNPVIFLKIIIESYIQPSQGKIENSDEDYDLFVVKEDSAVAIEQVRKQIGKIYSSSKHQPEVDTIAILDPDKNILSENAINIKPDNLEQTEGKQEITLYQNTNQIDDCTKTEQLGESNTEALLREEKEHCLSGSHTDTNKICSPTNKSSLIEKNVMHEDDAQITNIKNIHEATNEQKSVMEESVVKDEEESTSKGFASVKFNENVEFISNLFDKIDQPESTNASNEIPKIGESIVSIENGTTDKSVPILSKSNSVKPLNHNSDAIDINDGNVEKEDHFQIMSDKTSDENCEYIELDILRRVNIASKIYDDCYVTFSSCLNNDYGKLGKDKCETGLLNEHINTIFDLPTSNYPFHIYEKIDELEDNIKDGIPLNIGESTKLRLQKKIGYEEISTQPSKSEWTTKVFKFHFHILANTNLEISSSNVAIDLNKNENLKINDIIITKYEWNDLEKQVQITLDYPVTYTMMIFNIEVFGITGHKLKTIKKLSKLSKTRRELRRQWDDFSNKKLKSKMRSDREVAMKIIQETEERMHFKNK